MVFSEKVQHALIMAGWFPGRRIDTSRMEETLVGEGYEVSDAVTAFLSEFGDLVINFPNRGAKMSVQLGAIKDLHERVYEWSKSVGTPLCIIGENISGEIEEYMMDAEGKVYVFEENYFGLIGNTGSEAVENIITLNFSAGKKLYPHASAELREVLTTAHVIAVVCLEHDKHCLYYVPLLHQAGYNVYYVNPNLATLEGIPSCSNIGEIPEPVDIVNIAHSSEEKVEELVAEALRVGAKTIWIQPNNGSIAATKRALSANVKLILDTHIWHAYDKVMSDSVR